METKWLRPLLRSLKSNRGNVMNIIASLAIISIGLGVISMVTSAFYGNIDRSQMGSDTNIVVNNGTDVLGTTATLNYLVSTRCSGKAGSLSVAYDNSTGLSNISIGSTDIGTLSKTSPETFSIPSNLILDGTLGITYTMSANENVTDTNLTYVRCNGSETLDKIETATWGGLSMATVIPYILIGIGVIGLVIKGFGGMDD